MYSSQQITEWFLAHEPMPPKKLQELVYYTQGWSNALLKTLFNGDLSSFSLAECN